MVLPTVAWLSLFFVIPMLIVVAVSFASRTAYGQVVFNFTFANYARITESLYLSIFAQTFIVAVITTLFTIVMAYPLAYYIASLPKKWQQPGLILVMVPFWINFLIRSYAWVIILRTQGVLNTILMKLGLITIPMQFLYNDMAVLLGMIYSLLPFMVLPVYVSIEQLDRRLLEAASDLGASPFTAFRKVTLPLTMPGVAAGTRRIEAVVSNAALEYINKKISSPEKTPEEVDYLKNALPELTGTEKELQDNCDIVISDFYKDYLANEGIDDFILCFRTIC